MDELVSRQLGERVPGFESLCEDDANDANARSDVLDGSRILKWISENEIGHGAITKTPFGFRRVCYCDYTASGRSLSDIEGYIRSEVLPLYGNPHSSVTTTSEQSTLFLHEAREVIRSALGASEHDAVLFVGNGATAAVELLVHLMGLKEDVHVVASIREHHSNLLPWRECPGAKHSVVPEADTGQTDVEELERILQQIRATEGDNATIVGCFSAASNITGILENVNDVNCVLKRYNCLSLWDYATAAPYVEMNMNKGTPKDAIFFSGHKFIGGVQSPGVLVVKKKLIRCGIPKRIGGGTVFFVSATTHSYLKEVEVREEGGTPDVVGAARLALAFKLKTAAGCELIAKREHSIVKKVVDRLSGHPNISLLGAPRCHSRLSVFSFMVRDSLTSLFVHHNLVAALLNDLFGIQSRAGCACAGPYAQHLLGIDEPLALQYHELLKEDSRLDRSHLRRKGEYSQREMLRPGFTRVSIPFFASDETVQFIVQAIEFVATNAVRFIGQYQLNCESGEWHHCRQRVFRSRKWLGFAEFTNDGLRLRPRRSFPNVDPRTAEAEANGDLFAEAERLADEAALSKELVPDGRHVLDEKSQRLRWFVMAAEVADLVTKGTSTSSSSHLAKCPFEPKRYPRIADEGESGEGYDKSIETDAHGLLDPVLPSSSLENVQLHDDETCGGQDEVDNEEWPDIGIGDVQVSAVSKPTEWCCTAELSCGASAVVNQCSGALTETAEAVVVVEDNDDDWNKRIVVRHRAHVTNEEARKQPWVRPPAKLYRKVTEAIHSLQMIKDGDRILVALSGGKDSLSLLHLLRYYQQRCKQHRRTSFELAAITVDPGSSAFDPSPLIDYCRSLNIDYFYEKQDILRHAAELTECRSICSFCSRMKRGRLASAAAQHGYNVLAMGHHLDDLAESFLIAAFQNGNLSTMKACYVTRDRNLRVIRPLIYVREKSLREFAESNALPVIAENCPACFEQPKERYRMKQLLASHELIFPQLFASLRSALHPLLLVDSPFTSGMRALAIENIVKVSRRRENGDQAANDDDDDELL